MLKPLCLQVYNSFNQYSVDILFIMFSKQRYIGCPCEVEELVEFVDHLNSKVVEQINSSQELVMLNKFVRESNERHFIQSVKDRISDIASWQWVLQDLTKRLENAVPPLKYEHNAVTVVIERIQDELNDKAMEDRKLGAFSPSSDTVEEAVLEEYKFLKTRKKKFQNILPEIERHIDLLKDTIKKIEEDVLNKEQTINIEEACANINPDAVAVVDQTKNTDKRKRFTSMNKWICRCRALKDGGLLALRRSIILRQIIRGARVELSFGAQCYGAKVDAALRKRLHYNVALLEEINWQKDEVLKDLNSLEEELLTAEKSLNDTADQKHVVLKRIRDRTRRPYGEKTMDVVDCRLRNELSSAKHFASHLKKNIERIKFLQRQLKAAISHMDKCAEGTKKVLEIDQHRIRSRFGDESDIITNFTNSNSTSTREKDVINQEVTKNRNEMLSAIQEVDEENIEQQEMDEEDVEYPFDF